MRSIIHASISKLSVYYPRSIQWQPFIKIKAGTVIFLDAFSIDISEQFAIFHIDKRPGLAGEPVQYYGSKLMD